MKFGIRNFFKEKDNTINLLLTMILWVITISNYQVNAYYANFFPGDAFENLTVISTVELFAYIISGLAYDWFKGKQTIKLFVLSFGICLAGSLGILANDREKLPYVDMACNFIVKFGIASCYQAAYIANVLFPIVFSSTTFGICCMVGAIAGVFSPNIYQLEVPYQWYVFIALSLLGLACSLALRDKS